MSVKVAFPGRPDSSRRNRYVVSTPDSPMVFAKPKGNFDAQLDVDLLTAKLPILLNRKLKIGNVRKSSSKGRTSSGASSCSVPVKAKKQAAEKGSGDAPKRLRKISLLKAIKPINHVEEKNKFMKKKFEYDPQFVYSQPLDVDSHPKFGTASGKYLKHAIHIMKTTIVKYGSYEEFARISGGRVLDEETVTKQIQSYLKEENLTDLVELVVSKHCVSRGCLTKIRKGKHRLTVRPNLREGWIDGLLRHEVGTHYMRSYNNFLHPWRKKKKRKAFKLLPANPTEEGLASLHTILFRKHPSLWRAALLYYSTFMAMKLSFTELFHDLERFVLDPETRYDYCLRSKRGLMDTSVPGAFCKDQVYLHGALEILKNRKDIDFHLLIKLGKISFRNIDRISGEADVSKAVVPSFMSDMKFYHKCLDYIMDYNGLTDMLHNVK